MNKRTYSQYCSLAKALDIIGERWTLLIVRELASGPKRYQDLLACLPGIGTNLLADRLKQMQENGLIEKQSLPPPAATHVYNLAKRGLTLAPALKELSQWGYALLADPKPDDFFKAHWAVTFLNTSFKPEMAQSIEAVYAFDIEGDKLYIKVKDGRMRVLHGDFPEADLFFKMDQKTLKSFISGKKIFADMVSKKKIEAKGSNTALQHFLKIFGKPHEQNPPTWITT